MIKTTPERFRDAFARAVEMYGGELAECWNSGDTTRYTAAIRGVLPAMKQELGLELYNKDYYWLDAIFYETKDQKNFAPVATYAHQISIAIELENKLHGTQVEINKLQLFNSPLKVLITYASPDHENKWLAFYADLIKSADVFDDFSTHRSQLVIFGSCYDNRLRWSYQVYRDGGFVKI